MSWVGKWTLLWDWGDRTKGPSSYVGMSFLRWVFLGQPQHSVLLQDWALALPSP